MWDFGFKDDGDKRNYESLMDFNDGVKRSLTLFLLGNLL